MFGEQLSDEEIGHLYEALNFAAKGKQLTLDACQAALREEYEESIRMEKEASELLDKSIKILNKIDKDKLSVELNASIEAVQANLVKRAVGHWQPKE